MITQIVGVHNLAPKRPKRRVNHTEPPNNLVVVVCESNVACVYVPHVLLDGVNNLNQFFIRIDGR